MTSERRFRDEEVREIFAIASRHAPGGGAEAEPGGMTLAEIQEIGREAGLPPAAVSRAAAVLEARALAAPRHTLLGMPVGVGRTVPLPRSPTDEEWEMLVADLRSTFGARGRVSSHGNLREWFNGNLHACVEPTGSGYRLRLGTRRRDAVTLNVLGATGILSGAAVLASALLTGGATEALIGPAFLGGSGLLAIAANYLRLPVWARTREQQMEHIAERAAAIVRDPESTTPPALPPSPA